VLKPHARMVDGVASYAHLLPVQSFDTYKEYLTYLQEMRQENKWEHLYNTLMAQGKLVQAAIFLRGLSVGIMEDHEYTFIPADSGIRRCYNYFGIVRSAMSSKCFQEMLRLTLIISPLDDCHIVRERYGCAGCNFTVYSNQDNYNEQFHMAQCDIAKHTKCHNEVRDEIVKFYKKLRPTANVISEPHIRTHGHIAGDPFEGRKVRGDIYINDPEKDNYSKFLDVIVEGIARSGDTGSCRETQYATRRGETFKRAEYADFPRLVGSRMFVAFCVDSMGVIGNEANGFLEEIQKSNVDSSAAVTKLRKNIQHIVLKSTLWTIHDNRSKILAQFED